MLNSNISNLCKHSRSSARWTLALVLLAGCNTSTPPAAQVKQAEPQVVEKSVASARVVTPAPEQQSSEKLMSDKPADAPLVETVKEATIAQPVKEVAASEQPATVEKPAAVEKPVAPEEPVKSLEPAKQTEPAEPVQVAAVDQVAQAKAPTRSTSSSRSSSSSSKKKPAKAPVAPPPPPPPPSMPPVLMSDTEAKTCLVKVGDTMPAIELPGADGQTQSLAKLMGEKLTIVVFWTANHPYAVEELGDLAAEVAGPLASKGVKVVAINEGDTPEAARKAAQDAGAGALVQLQDTGGTALAKVASRRLPRTYLLDSSGKILWFDIEYSRSTRRDLQHALEFLLGTK